MVLIQMISKISKVLKLSIRIKLFFKLSLCRQADLNFAHFGLYQQADLKNVLLELVLANGPPFCIRLLVLASEPLDYLLELGLASGLPFCTRWIVPASGPLVTSQLNEIFDNVFFCSKYLLFFIIFLFSFFFLSFFDFFGALYTSKYATRENGHEKQN